MVSAYRVIAVLLSLTVAVFGQQPSIELQITQTHVKPGNEITLTCRVTNKGDNAVHMIKTYQKEDSTPASIIISTNSVLLRKHPRYKLDEFDIAGVNLYHLVISNVTYEDSGNYACGLAEDQSIKDMVVLYVYHPVSELSFNNYTAGQAVSVNETSEIDLVCKAAGSIPAATIKVTLGSEDITGKFRKSTHSTTHCTSAAGCLVHQTHTTIATMPGFRPTWKDNSKRLSCLANVENSGFYSEEVSFKLEMQYPPKFVPEECQSIVVVRLHSEYEISCKISSNPSNPEFYWSFMWGGSKQKLSKDQKSDDGEFKAGQHSNKDGTIMAWLRVKDVSTRHLMTYNLNVNNSLGSNETTITLREDPRYRISLPPDNSNSNGASSMAGAGVILFPVYLLFKIFL